MDRESARERRFSAKSAQEREARLARRRALDRERARERHASESANKERHD